MSTTEARTAYSGRTRRMQTRWTVRAGDFVAQWCITIGGIGTIVAVLLVFLFLFAVVAPIFMPARLSREHSRDEVPGQSVALAFGVDEFRMIGWTLRANGEFRAFQIESGQEVLRQSFMDGVHPSAATLPIAGDEIAIGASDGTLRLGVIQFSTKVLSSAESFTPALRQLSAGQRAVQDGSVFERTPQGQWRQQQLEFKINQTVPIAKSSIRLLDHLVLGGGDDFQAKKHLVAHYAEDGGCRFTVLDEQENLITGEKSFETTSFDLPYRKIANAEPFQLLITGHGDGVFLVWNNGQLQRFDVRDTEKIKMVEETRLLGNPNLQVTACGLLLGRETLIVGDSGGGLRAWFRTRHSDDDTGDGQRMNVVHDLAAGTAAVTAWNSSPRGRTVLAGYADGTIRIFYVTTEKRVLEKRIADGQPIRGVTVTPKEDGLVVFTDRAMWTADYDPRHPEVTLTSMFRPVWYEGYDRPMHIWQSSFSTATPEMKLGLMPLVFGTFKATFYTMLFSVPLALLAAVYTSEFMHPRARRLIKPTIEMMASLPSVVLGFLAALVFAPIVAHHLSSILATMLLAPFMYLAFAHLWQALPHPLLLRWHHLRFPLLFIPLPLGIIAGFAAGPILEQRLFAGNVMQWLDGQIGTGMGGWILLWLPVCALLTAIWVTMHLDPMLRGFLVRCTRGQAVVLSLVKFIAASIVAVALATLISYLLYKAGWDPRGAFVDTYVQRNALIVGAVMGVAVIPIIYTIADDALNTVPQHLRSASLGCGATPWQTAFRVVVPTAMSGLFSAVMIGLGRAVGETMIVLMAGGNTPVMEWNPFSGFRSLSANIAVELPEAVRDSTHYRTLFFAALTLFLLTFVLNTVAELVRLRFRKRAFQL